LETHCSLQDVHTATEVKVAEQEVTDTHEQTKNTTYWQMLVLLMIGKLSL